MPKGMALFSPLHPAHQENKSNSILFRGLDVEVNIWLITWTGKSGVMHWKCISLHHSFDYWLLGALVMNIFWRTNRNLPSNLGQYRPTGPWLSQAQTAIPGFEQVDSMASGTFTTFRLAKLACKEFSLQNHTLAHTHTYIHTWTIPLLLLTKAFFFFCQIHHITPKSHGNLDQDDSDCDSLSDELQRRWR